MQTRAVWIIELSELDTLSRSEVSRIKAFMSRMTDRFRPPYGKRLIESPRQCLFAGTVNHSTYLQDDTGARRFWPVACGRIDIDRLLRDRDQLLTSLDRSARLSCAALSSIPVRRTSRYTTSICGFMRQRPRSVESQLVTSGSIEIVRTRLIVDGKQVISRGHNPHRVCDRPVHISRAARSIAIAAAPRTPPQ